MTSDTLSTFVVRAVDLAKQASQEGNAPFGAVIVNGDKMLAESQNRTQQEGNPTLHAEMAAIRQACLDHGATSLEGSTIYCSCEPCIMCLSAIYYSGIKTIVFAATLTDAIRLGSGDPNLSTRRLNKIAHLGLEIIPYRPQRKRAVELFSTQLARYGRL